MFEISGLNNLLDWKDYARLAMIHLLDTT
jgi:hypothetical protein